jgi:hypothetical protein
MKPYMINKILGSDVLGADILALISVAWAPITATAYGRALRGYFDFRDEHILASIPSPPAHMAR